MAPALKRGCSTRPRCCESATSSPATRPCGNTMIAAMTGWAWRRKSWPPSPDRGGRFDAGRRPADYARFRGNAARAIGASGARRSQEFARSRCSPALRGGRPQATRRGADGGGDFRTSTQFMCRCFSWRIQRGRGNATTVKEVLNKGAAECSDKGSTVCEASRVRAEFLPPWGRPTRGRLTNHPRTC